jgi:hypothetical protein
MNTNLRRVMGPSLVAVALLLAGSVVLASDRVPGDPIPGASVKVGRKPPGGGKIVAHGTTDAKGSCTFEDLEPGTYFVTFEVAGQKYRISANDAGEMITIAAPPAGDGATATRIASRPVVYTKNLGKVIATVEIQGNFLAANLNLSKSNVD